MLHVRLYIIIWKSKGYIRLGDHVFLERAGDVIPKIRGIDIGKRSYYLKKFIFPTKCPSCCSLVEFDNVLVRCPNNISALHKNIKNYVILYLKKL